MLRILLSAQTSPARLSGLLLIPPVQPCCLGPSKSGDRPFGGGPVQGLQRLLEQARSPGELLRWLSQNPTKVRAHHYPVALRRLGQLLVSQPRPSPVEQATLQDLSQLIIRNCPSFDVHTIHVCLHLAVLLGFPSDGPLLCALEQERRSRVPPKPPSPRQPAIYGGQRLEAALSCPRFLRYPRQHLIRSLAEARPEELTPHVMVLLAQHLARHRLREPQLLEAIAHFLVVQEAQLNSKVVQKLVLPFGRLNYLPLEQQFMPCLERILAREAGVAPLATVNILMSLCQLQRLPFRALQFVFSPSFISHINGTPPSLIVRRYLSLLDTAVELELPGYRGPRLPQRQRVPIFPQPLITDRARCKYSHKDMVAEGLRQLLGEEKYRQDLTVPPGYCTDFLLCVGGSGAVLPMRTQDPFLPYPPRPCQQDQANSNSTTQDPTQRVVLMLRERWHFCRDGRVLLGSRALRERHLGLMGYQLLPLPFEELESQRGLPQLKSYLRQKLQALGLRWGPEGG
ncbi:rCG24330, isoform CRA_c [Rattus norvegicus]|uniref:RCG24330, isoform CRA_c n=3 Tax=Rattus norvegicus TaxID=10116 RepID=A6K549_RAT|nr:fas-activated serine/threonine kinase isoform X3 [Rattus norvegicus]XP_006235957.1 fas-activated serine/threonine kinase isoform X3 [Rattus norvegicus]XP_017448427.1 fas-activated serine/threonine kinase isoform X3 [Rattus norvegicus]XP_032763019.1 fas-activated serine/threonine kinase isoform X2 [Rattus rattus]XP_032763020.1 fas-activated serine/threonine kinase isoform X2 [Rattus rattus]XP_032763021.1 fas-activated serine/threonine kinase isoform X2 [Rattus rattus]EDL99358.1 rCG24330, is|eukprot:XP_006235956.1 PREDICTED: fas-activated serine/threonine kinase isoform X2 [Rattus norvegicus]